MQRDDGHVTNSYKRADKQNPAQSVRDCLRERIDCNERAYNQGYRQTDVFTGLDTEAFETFHLQTITPISAIKQENPCKLTAGQLLLGEQQIEIYLSSLHVGERGSCRVWLWLGRSLARPVKTYPRLALLSSNVQSNLSMAKIAKSIISAGLLKNLPSSAVIHRGSPR